MGRKKHQTYENASTKARDRAPTRGMSKKKKQQKDFQKVKLKAGQHRPKGLNETKLQFQSKSILIREQLHRDASKERVQDILIRLRRGTAAQKLAVLDSLKQRLQNDELDTWLPSLQSLLDTCTSYLSLESVSQYRSALQCLKTIFTRVQPVEVFDPLMPLVCQRLISLMTHLNDDIRERSVPVLELLLHQSHSSTLLTNHALAILESLLQQLMKTSRSERQFLSTIDTTTAGNNSGHARLLDCIAHLVNIVFDRYHNEQSVTKDSKQDDEKPPETLFQSLQSSKSKPFRFMDQLFQFRSDSVVLSRVIDLLLKVLLQFWSEMRIHLGDRYHHRGALSCLWCCTRIFHRLLHSISSDRHYDTELHNIIAQHSQSIHKHLLQNFPFDEHQGADILSTKQVQQKNLTVRRLNIHIIDLLATQFPDLQQRLTKTNAVQYQLKSDQMQPLLDYMFNLLNNNEKHLTIHETKDTLEFVEKCIRSFRDDGIIRQCIDGISNYVQRSMNDLHINHIAFRILCDSLALRIAKLDAQTIASLPVDEMVWFVFQVLRSSETEFNQNERLEILQRMTQIFSFELDPFSTLLNNIWLDYFAILKTSNGIEQRLLVTWLYGINGKQRLASTFFLTFQQYIQWHCLEIESAHLLFGILLRQFDRHGRTYCSIDDLAGFIFRFLFTSFKIDGYVVDKTSDIEADRLFKHGEVIISHLQRLKIHRNDLIEALWIRIENALASNKQKQLKWFEWASLYALISIDDIIVANSLVQSRLGAHLIQTIQRLNHDMQQPQQQTSQLILARVRTSPALKRILRECESLVGNDPDLHAMCISLLD